MHRIKTFCVQITELPKTLHIIDECVRDFFSDLMFEAVIISSQDAIHKAKGEEYFVRTIVYTPKPKEAKQ